jgi:hypothetical protein
MADQDKSEICKRLRTRMYYVLGRDHPDLWEQAPSAVYWCSITGTALGPDTVYCAPNVCYSARRCFEAKDGES